MKRQYLCYCRVTGRGYMDVNRISGYIPGKIVTFLMQVWRFDIEFKSCAQAAEFGMIATFLMQVGAF